MEQNPFPKIDLFPRVTKAVEWIKEHSILGHLPSTPLASHGDHFVDNLDNRDTVGE